MTNMENNFTEENRQTSLKTLKASYEMYVNTRFETEQKRKKTVKGNPVYSEKDTETTIALIDNMMADIKDKYLQLGGSLEELTSITPSKEKKSRKEILKAAVEAANAKDAMKSYMQQMANEQPAEPSPIKPIDLPNTDIKVRENIIEVAPEIEQPKPTEIVINDNTKRNYDTVKLPSKGECYKNKVSELRVCQLVAYDENMIFSANLYRTGEFLDHILKAKLIDGINPDDLVQGDRDAIIIWLRANGYGNEYPIKMVDDKTGKEFETVVDLSKLNYKPFNLKADENGYFDFVVPSSGDIIKFRFLTNGDAKKLAKQKNAEDNEIKITNLKKYSRELRSCIENNDLIKEEVQETLLQDIDNLENKVLDNIEEKTDRAYTHELTNRILLSTVAVNGISDRNYVVQYILNMNLRDAAAYRKYIIDNEPGIDYNIKVERPESLGGGFIETFLQLDQFIFIN